MGGFTNPDRTFPELLFELLNRGKLRDRSVFLSAQSSRTPTEEIFATRMDRFFGGGQSGINASEELCGALHFVLRFSQTGRHRVGLDRKSTRLNSSHLGISYAVFCLKNRFDQKNTILQLIHLGFSGAVLYLLSVD